MSLRVSGNAPVLHPWCCAGISASVDLPSPRAQELEIYCFLVSEMRGAELPSAITSSKVLQGIIDKFPGATHVHTHVRTPMHVCSSKRAERGLGHG